MTDQARDASESPTQQVIAEAIRLLNEEPAFDAHIVEALKRLAESGRLGKPKELAEVLKLQEASHENPAT